MLRIQTFASDVTGDVATEYVLVGGLGAVLAIIFFPDFGPTVRAMIELAWKMIF